MRYPIWKKKDFFQFTDTKRIDMDADVVRIPEEDLDLFWNFDMDPQHSHGRVTDIRLEDGEITGEPVFTHPSYKTFSIEDIDCRLGGYYTDVEKTADGSRVTRCTLRSVSVVLNSSIPKED